jgi:L-amino acid N-acyltransferase YncA
MRPADALTFETEDHRRIYEFVERRGTARSEEVWEALRLDPETFHHEVTILKRDGYLAEDEAGRLRIAMDAGSAEEYEEGGVTYTVRPARQEDHHGIVGVIRNVAREHTNIVAESVVEELDFEDVLIRHNDVGSRMFFIATVECDVVGWTHLDIPELEKLDHTAEQTMGVLEEYREHGIGSHLLQRGLTWARSNDRRRVYTSLPATNPAGIGFLLDHDWQVEAVRPDHYRTEGELIDEVMLAYEFDAG